MLVGRGGGRLGEGKFFPSPRPHTINPTTSTHGHFLLFPVLLALRDHSTIDINDLNVNSLNNNCRLGVKEGLSKYF